MKQDQINVGSHGENILQGYIDGQLDIVVPCAPGSATYNLIFSAAKGPAPVFTNAEFFAVPDYIEGPDGFIQSFVRGDPAGVDIEEAMSKIDRIKLSQSLIVLMADDTFPFDGARTAKRIIG